MAYSSIASSANTPPGILPSFNSFSSRVISAKVFALRMSCSTRLRSLSVSFTRDTFSVLFAEALAWMTMDSVDGTEKVRDLMFEIFKMVS